MASTQKKLALVTGASAGIGKALAAELARNGFDLLLVARRADRLEQLAAELTAAHKITAHTFACDLSAPDAAATIFTHVESLGLTVDALINNAGLGQNGKFHELPADTMHQVLQVNIVALTAMTRAFLPGMIARGRGHVMNVGSVAGFMPGPGMAIYYASKAFVASFSDALAIELAGTGVTMTNLCPGATESEFSAVAQMESSRLFNAQPVMSAESVAAQGVAGMLRGQATVITGINNKLTVATIRHAPRSMAGRITQWINGPM